MRSTDTAPPVAERAKAPAPGGFWRLWAATTASGLGDGTRIAAMAVYAAALSGDPLHVALVALAGKLPWTCVGLFTGALADRVDRWRTLWICDVARAVVMACLVVLIVTGHVGIAVLAVVSFLLTSIATLAESLSQAVVPDVAGPTSLETANSRLMGGQLLFSEFLGAPLGTALFVLGRPLPFALDTLTFAVSAVLVCGVRVPRDPGGPPRAGDLTARSVLRDTAEGVRWLWHRRELRTVCLLVGLLNFSVVAVMGIAVLYALEVLGTGERGYGVLLVVVAAGGLAGVLAAPRVTAQLGRGRALRVAFALCPVPFVVAGCTSDGPVAAVALAVVGASMSLVTVVTVSVRQSLVPTALFGRVNGGYRLVVNGLSPLGSLAGGVTASAWGLRAPFFLAAAAAEPPSQPLSRAAVADPAAPPPPAPRGWWRTGPLPRLLVPLLAAVAATVTALGAVTTPDPLPASAPAGTFSADRAHEHVAAVAGRPHHVGTAANDAVRDELVARFTALGLTPRVLPGTGADTESGAAMVGWTRNIAATVPGTAPTGRVLVVAHYDSAETSHGASDDGLGVATALEIARAVTAGPAPRNDITFLLTDGEEPGMLGARAFVAADRGAAESTVVLNLEARGTSGRAVMFQTGSGDSELLAALGDRVPVATSLSDEIYGMLPNDTDFTVLRDAGTTGLNFAVIAGSANYHTPRDSLDTLSRDSLQDMGETTLAATRHLARADLGGVADGGDSTYFSLAGLLVRYPASLVLPGALLAVAGAVAALVAARRRGALRLRATAAVAATLPLALLVAAAAGSALWPALTWLRPEWTGFALGSPYRPGPVALAAVLSAAVVTWVWAVRVRRRATGPEVSAAVTVWLALCAVLTAVVLPGASYLFLWPALAGAGGLAVAARLPAASPWRAAATTAAVLPAAALMAPIVVLLFDTVPLALVAVPLPLVVLCLAAALPAAAKAVSRRTARSLTALGTLAAVAAAGTALPLNRPDAAHPAQVSLVHTRDADTGRALWASNGTGRSAWLERYVGAGTTALEDRFPSLDEPAAWRTGPAPAVPSPEPRLTVKGITRHGDVRRVRLHVATVHGRAAELALYADAQGAPVVRATAAGHTVPGGANRDADRWTWGLLLTAPPATGTEVVLDVRGDRPLLLRAVALTPGLPAGSLTVPRPRDVTWSAQDAGVSLVSRSYRW
ncbi:MFS transporter [Streptomyces sp. WAC05374]|uniref:MFS transporter n=1 Tax=Streptomyces sp. WAC05374 TaxID=2487420 RepID=UPI000F887EFF|nr:MFS transporter [Streptomyces sp. WAC05374]RST18339.1 MFS transporter [Streptomyces sp. WAC05374]